MHILVFGATGATGKHFVKQALSAKHKVSVIVRNPDKLPKEWTENPDFVAYKGDLSDEKTILQVLEKLFDNNLDALIFMVKLDAQKKDKVMSKLVPQIVTMMKNKGVKKLLYQAGAFAPKPNEKNTFVFSMIRGTFEVLAGYGGMLKDNDSVIKYLSTDANDIAWNVTRPAMIVEKPSMGKLIPSDKAPMNGITFSDLAAYNLSLLENNDLKHTCDCLVYEKK